MEPDDIVIEVIVIPYGGRGGDLYGAVIGDMISQGVNKERKSYVPGGKT